MTHVLLSLLPFSSTRSSLHSLGRVHSDESDAIAKEIANNDVLDLQICSSHRGRQNAGRLHHRPAAGSFPLNGS